MKKVKLLFTVPIIFSPILAISCSQNQVDFQYKEDVFQMAENPEQLQTLLANGIFFQKEKAVKLNTNQIQNLIKNFHKNNNDSKVTLEALYNSSSVDMQKLNIFGLSYLKEIKKEAKFTTNLQAIIYDILLNTNYYGFIFPNLISPDNIRIQAWKINQEQKTYFEVLLKFYLQGLKIKDLDSVRVTFNELDKINIALLDSNQNYLFDNWQNINFELPKFRDYNKNKTFPNKFALNINDSEVLFNEYIKNHNLSFKSNPLLINTVENIIDNVPIYKRATSKGLISTLYKMQDSTEIKVPFYKQDEDLKYQINWTKTLEHPWTNFLNNSYTIVPLYIDVFKKNGTVQTYKWYSIDFNNHRHIFDGFYLEPNLDFDIQKKYSLANFSQFEQNQEMHFESQINLKSFLETNLLNILNFYLNDNFDNLSLWNGQSMNNFDPFNFQNKFSSHKQFHFLSILISLILNSFLFSFENNKLIEPIVANFSQIQINDKQAGTIETNLEIRKLRDFQLIYKSPKILISGFNGFNLDNLKKFKKEYPETNFKVSYPFASWYKKI